MRRATFAVAILFLIPPFALAQSRKDSWDNLRHLQPGEKIEVVDMHLKTFKGELVSYTDEEISLREKKGEQSVARADVMRVSVRDTSHRTRNMLLGAGIAGGIAIAAAMTPLIINSNEGNGCGPCYAAIAAGFGGGAAIGAIPSSRTIYRVKK